MRVIIATRCHGVTRDDGDRLHPKSPKCYIISCIFFERLSDFSICNSYALHLISLLSFESNCAMIYNTTRVIRHTLRWFRGHVICSLASFKRPPKKDQGTQLILSLDADCTPTPQLWTSQSQSDCSDPFFWDATLRFYVYDTVCHHNLSLILIVSKWGSNRLPISIKTSTLLAITHQQLLSLLQVHWGPSLANFACTRTSSAARTIFI